MVLMAVMAFLNRIVTKQSVDLKEEKRSRQWMLSAGLLSGILMVTWYTLMEPNLWDPQKGLYVGSLWILWIVNELGNASISNS